MEEAGPLRTDLANLASGEMTLVRYEATKVDGVFHEAALIISERGIPLNQAIDDACALTSWALGESSGVVKGVIVSTNHLDMVSLDAGL